MALISLNLPTALAITAAVVGIAYVTGPNRPVAGKGADHLELATLVTSKEAAVLPITYSSDTVTVPLKPVPNQPERQWVDVERMITDAAFDGQVFPDYVCPPDKSKSDCDLMMRGVNLELKEGVTDRYTPTSRLCRQIAFDSAMKGTATYVSLLDVQKLVAVALASGQDLSAPDQQPLTFNPQGYHLYRKLMAAEVCLGLRDA